MPNSFINIESAGKWVTMKTLQLLLNKLEVAQFFNTEFNKELTREFPVGETFMVKLPWRPVIRTGLGYNPQTINRLTTPVTCDKVFGVDFQWDSIEQALQMERGEDEIAKQYLEPAAAQLKQEIDSRCALFAYQNANNIVGVLGTDPTSFKTFSNAARQRMIELACPAGGEKGGIVAPGVVTSLVDAGVQYFNPSSEISRQYKEGSIGRQGGFDWYESMSIYSHTAGTWQGAVTVAGAGQSGSSLLVNCTSGDTFNQGDVIGIQGVYDVNPSTRRQTQSATTSTIVVSQDVTATDSTATIPFVKGPWGLRGPGDPYQTVTALPADTATLTLFPGTELPNGKSGKNGLFIHPDAFALVSVKFQNPKAVEIASQTRDPNTGISIAFVRAFDPVERRMINRFDCMLGFGVLYGDSCCVRGLSA